MTEAARVRRDRQEQVAVVTIDRPEMLNALNRSVVAALKDELRAAITGR